MKCVHMFPRHTNKTETGSEVEEEAIGRSGVLSIVCERVEEVDWKLIREK